MFEESYYKTGNYVNYLDKKQKYVLLAEDVFLFLNSICMGDKNKRILDFGCAVGHFMDGLEKIGYNNIWGYDISRWATSEASKRHKIISQNELYEEKFDICFAFDVLEHMTDEQVKYFLQNIKCEILFLRIPVSNNGGKSFVLDVSNNDATHINCKEKKDWEKILKENDFQKLIKLNLNSIYDSDGVLSGFCFKKGIDI